MTSLSTPNPIRPSSAAAPTAPIVPAAPIRRWSFVAATLSLGCCVAVVPLFASSVNAQPQPPAQPLPVSPEDAAKERERRLAEARQRWAALTPEQRQRVMDRFKEFQNLPADQREKALENFRQLFGELEKAVPANPTPNPTPGSNANPESPRHPNPTQNPPGNPPPPPRTDLERLVERFAGDPLYRERLRQLDRELRTWFAESPALLEILESLSGEEQRDFVAWVRRQAGRQAIRQAIRDAGGSDEAAKKVIDIMEAAHEAEDAAFKAHQESLAAVERELTTAVREHCGEDAANAARRFFRTPPFPFGSGFGRHGGDRGDRGDRFGRGPQNPPDPQGLGQGGPNGFGGSMWRWALSWRMWEGAAKRAGIEGEALAAVHQVFDKLVNRFASAEAPPKIEDARRWIAEAVESIGEAITPEQRQKLLENLLPR